MNVTTRIQMAGPPDVIASIIEQGWHQPEKLTTLPCRDLAPPGMSAHEWMAKNWGSQSGASYVHVNTEHGPGQVVVTYETKSAHPDQHLLKLSEIHPSVEFNIMHARIDDFEYPAAYYCLRGGKRFPVKFGHGQPRDIAEPEPGSDKYFVLLADIFGKDFEGCPIDLDEVDIFSAPPSPEDEPGSLRELAREAATDLIAEPPSEEDVMMVENIMLRALNWSAEQQLEKLKAS